MEKNKRDLRILILSAPIGSGHRLAAEALKEYLESLPGVVVEHGNVFSFFPGFLGRTFLKCYMKLLDYCPWLYELAYKWGNRGGGSLWLRALINRSLAWLGRSYILKQRPDAVIATHATPAGIVSYIKKSHPLWLGCVITDYTVHRWWLVEGADTYFISEPQLREKLPGVKDIQSFGIPLRGAFKALQREAALMELGWRPEDRHILLLGGGEGLLPMEEIINNITRRISQPVKLVAVTGHNEKLKARLEQTFKELLDKDRLKVYGFTQALPQLMAASGLVISKAGGLSTAELLASGADFILYKPLPGQEENNAAFVGKHFGVGLARTPQELTERVQAWLEVPVRTERPYYGKPLAAKHIGDYVLQQISGKF